MSEATQNQGTREYRNSGDTAPLSWEEVIAHMHAEWPVLTDSDLRAIDAQAFTHGKYDTLVRRLRERYRLTEDGALTMVTQFIHNDQRRARPRVRPSPGTQFSHVKRQHPLIR